MWPYFTIPLEGQITQIWQYNFFFSKIYIESYTYKLFHADTDDNSVTKPFFPEASGKYPGQLSDCTNPHYLVAIETY
jgi:hypothetical protein